MVEASSCEEERAASGLRSHDAMISSRRTTSRAQQQEATGDRSQCWLFVANRLSMAQRGSWRNWERRWSDKASRGQDSICLRSRCR